MFTTVATDLSSKQLFKRLWRDHLKSHIWRLSAAFVFMAIAALMTAALAKLMEPVLDKIFVEKNQQDLISTAFLIASVFSIKGLATFAQDVTMGKIGLRIIADFQSIMFEKLLRADLGLFHRTSTGQLVSRFTNDVSVVRFSVAAGTVNLGKDFLTLILLVGLMFHQDWRLAAASFVVFPLAFFPIVILGKRMRRVSRKVQESQADMTTRLEQSFQGIRHVKAYTNEAREADRTQTLVERLFNLSYRGAVVRASPKAFMEVLAGITITIIVLYGGSQVIAGELTTGKFFSFITALLLAYEPLKKLARLNTSLQEGLAAAQRIFEVIDLEPKIVDKPGAKELMVSKGEVEFKSVTFRYGAGAPAALDAIDLHIPAGKTTALVGLSGAGKTTVLNLIPRFFDIESGQILVDGQSVGDVTMKSLRQQIGLVSQETSLFDDSIRENIAYGQPDATEEQVIAAAKAAAAHDFIMGLSNGYDTPVGEHGIMLSGGQRQRVAIARAMLKNAPILLLDEATSALDSESEAEVVASLKTLMKGRTSLVIAHRLSTIIDADLIYLIDRGRVLEQGTHQDLLKQNGQYANLFAAQVFE